MYCHWVNGDVLTDQRAERRGHMPSILCAGLIAVDMVFEVDAFPVEGSKNRAESSDIITGGGAMNAASAISSLGGDVALAGVIGDDLFGAFLRQKMQDRRIEDRFVQTAKDAATSRSATMISTDGDRTIVNDRDATLGLASLALPPGFAFDAALVDTRWPTAAAAIVAAATQAGKPVVVDAEAPVALAQKALDGASHVVFSEQGLAEYAGASTGEALAQVAARLGSWCAVTRGPLPVLCHDGARLTEIPTLATTALNTLGAGDVWHGAFTLALAQGRSEGDAALWANAAASLKVRRPVHVEDLPRADEVAAALEQDLKEQELSK
jgi:sulfofructose kinase